MACGYCHNPHLISGSPPPEFLSTQEIWEFLTKRRPVLQGVVITGGEPLLHLDLGAWIDRLREGLGYKIKLDTNGTLPKALSQMNVDYVAMDLKLPTVLYSRLGYHRDTSLIGESIQYLRSGAVGHEFRTVWIPGFSKLENLEPMARELGEEALLYVAGFRPGKTLDPAFSQFRAPSPSELEEVVARFQSFGVNARIRG